MINSGVAASQLLREPAGTPLVDGTSTVDFGSVPFSGGMPGMGGGMVERTFTIKNTGSGYLTGLMLNIDGAHMMDFMVAMLPISEVPSLGSQSFVVRFTPMGMEARTAVLHITSNDPDESPFDIVLTGTGAPPDIAVEQPAGALLVDGVSAVDFGSSPYPGAPPPMGAVVERIFTIKNTGSGHLAGLTLNIDGANMMDFMVMPLPFAELAAGGSQTFVMNFIPMGLGSRTAVLHVTSNDPDETPFDISLSGIGVDPSSDATSPTVGISTPPGGAVFAMLPVLVAGTASDNIGVISVRLRVNGGAWSTASGTTAWSGSVSLMPGSNLIEAQSMDAAGNLSSLASRTVTFTPSGTDIAVEQPAGTGLVDGVSSVDFGSQPFPSAAPWMGGSVTERTFTIKNTGGTTLMGLMLNIDGAHMMDFMVMQPPIPEVEPGESQTFMVSFIPMGMGARTAVLHITSNDPDESPFDIVSTNERRHGG